jgi:ABC-type polysaccharide/polyol phosphate transport system ATPase subunit
MAFIEVKGITLDIPIVDASRSFRSALISHYTGGRIRRSERKDRVVVRALDNVSFRVEHGDRLGLLGHNGSGKSTLLKVMAGVYMPTAGSVAVEGSVTPLFNPGIGMDMDDTGYQNISNIGLFLGLTPAEIESKTDEIANFCELGDFLALPARTYSAGMIVRLSFAVATALRPEILLLDEGIGAGDARFAERAQHRLNRFYETLSIMVLATHGTGMIRQMCNKALLLEQGRMIAFGDVDMVIETYHERTESSKSSLTVLGSMFSEGEVGVPRRIESVGKAPGQSLAAAAESDVLRVAELPVGLGSGKWYWEIHSPNAGLFEGALARSLFIGVTPLRPGEAPDTKRSDKAGPVDFDLSHYTQGWGWRADGVRVHGGQGNPWGTVTDSAKKGVLMVAVDLDEGQIWFGRDGRWFSAGNPAEGKNPAFKDVAGPLYPIALLAWNGAGQVVATFEVYKHTLKYEPPAGFVPLDAEKAHIKLLKQAERSERERLRTQGIISSSVEAFSCLTAEIPIPENVVLTGGLSDAPLTMGILPVSLGRGRWYWEAHSPNAGALDGVIAATAMLGVSPAQASEARRIRETTLYSKGVGWRADGVLVRDGQLESYGHAPDTGECIFMVALDLEAGSIWFGLNGEWYEGGDPADNFLPAVADVSGNVSPSIAVGYHSNGAAVLGLKCSADVLVYPPPAGFRALDSDEVLAKQLKAAEALPPPALLLGEAPRPRPSDASVTVVTVPPRLAFTNNAGIGKHQIGRLPVLLDRGKWYWELRSRNVVALDGPVAETASIGVAVRLRAGALAADQARQSVVPFRDIEWLGMELRAIGRRVAQKLPPENGPRTYMVALDVEAGALWLGVDGVWAGSGDPAPGTEPVLRGAPDLPVSPAATIVHTEAGSAMLEFVVKPEDQRYAAPPGFQPLAVPADAIADARRNGGGVQVWLD